VQGDRPQQARTTQGNEPQQVGTTQGKEQTIAKTRRRANAKQKKKE